MPMQRNNSIFRSAHMFIAHDATDLSVFLFYFSRHRKRYGKNANRNISCMSNAHIHRSERLLFDFPDEDIL